MSVAEGAGNYVLDNSNDYLYILELQANICRCCRTKFPGARAENASLARDLGSATARSNAIKLAPTPVHTNEWISYALASHIILSAQHENMTSDADGSGKHQPETNGQASSLNA